MTTPSDPARWARINDLFHRALDQPDDARAAFVARECGDDAGLRDEVLSLIGAHARAADFIEQPAAAVSLIDGGAAPDAVVGQLLGHYRIVRVLGRGGMGVVYLAEDTKLGRPVALKALAPRFTGDETRRERLRREARAAAALHHSGIATVFALEEIGNQLYIAGEYVPGATLRETLSRGPLGADAATATMRAIALAVAAAHDRGIVHRDLKPENVIMTPTGDVKILDFGLARLEEPAAVLQLTADGTVLGTPAYMSPEQIRGGVVDARSDVFALGVMLHEMVTGVHPFLGSDPASTIAHVLEDEPAPLAAHPAIDRVVRMSVRKSPDARYPSVRAFLAALDEAVASPHQRVVPGADGARWWWQFHQTAASAAYVALLVPLNLVRADAGNDAGTTVLLLGIVAAITAVVLRLHLLFAVRSYPAEFEAQLARSGPWIRRADVAFALVLAAAGVIVRTQRLSLAILLIASAVAVLLASAIIEPATTRAMAGNRGD